MDELKEKKEEEKGKQTGLFFRKGIALERILGVWEFSLNLLHIEFSQEKREQQVSRM